jgi:hypothetical protein
MNSNNVFDDLLDDCNDDVVICGITLSASQILKACYPIVYRGYLADYENNKQYEQDEQDEDEGEMK